MAQKIDRRTAVAQAEKAWAQAPGHIRAMAGAYVGPLLDALRAIGGELDGIAGRGPGGCCTGNCNQGRDCPAKGASHGES